MLFGDVNLAFAEESGGFVGKYIDDLKKLQSTFDLGVAYAGAKITESKLQTTNFDVALGLRTNIAKYHGVELAVRVPFIKINTLNVNVVVGGGTMTITTKSTISQNIRVLARYTFSF